MPPSPRRPTAGCTAWCCPPELDAFFTSITARDFTQLRSEPIRAAYGGHVMLTTTLLDLLADEGRASEFAFVFTNGHFGFLFSKLGAVGSSQAPTHRDAKISRRRRGRQAT